MLPSVFKLYVYVASTTVSFGIVLISFLSSAESVLIWLYITAGPFVILVASITIESSLNLTSPITSPSFSLSNS